MKSTGSAEPQGIPKGCLSDIESYLSFYQGLIYLNIEKVFLHQEFSKHPLRVSKYHKRLQKTPMDIPKAAEGEPEHPNRTL